MDFLEMKDNKQETETSFVPGPGCVKYLVLQHCSSGQVQHSAGGEGREDDHPHVHVHCVRRSLVDVLVVIVVVIVPVDVVVVVLIPVVGHETNEIVGSQHHGDESKCIETAS